MQIILDGLVLAEAELAAGTLESAIRRVQTDRCSPSQVVVAIRCDNRDVPDDQIAAALRKPVSTVDKLEVFTSTRQQLVASAMAQASISLQETETACGRVAELLNKGSAKEAIAMLGECLRIWQQVHEAVAKSIQMLDMNTDTITLQDATMTDVIGKPKEVLLQIRNALLAQDHVLLADLLRYEFDDVTDSWYALIARIRQEAEGDVE